MKWRVRLGKAACIPNLAGEAAVRIVPELLEGGGNIVDETGKRRKFAQSTGAT